MTRRRRIRSSRIGRRLRNKTKRVRGGSTILPSPQKIEVVTAPVPYNETAYPSLSDTQKQLAATIAQNNANAATDKVPTVATTSQSSQPTPTK
jgi:hypothetical protein